VMLCSRCVIECQLSFASLCFFLSCPSIKLDTSTRERPLRALLKERQRSLFEKWVKAFTKLSVVLGVCGKRKEQLLHVSVTATGRHLGLEDSVVVDSGVGAGKTMQKKRAKQICMRARKANALETDR
jgi:hypothetical protein